MKDKKKLKWAGKLRPAVFLLPAAILVAVVLITLPLTAPVLRSLPERLEYIMPVVAEAATVKAEKPGKNKEEKKPAAFFDYKDGIFTGSAYGYGGDVQVEVTVKDGYITEVAIVNAPGETEPYFTLAKSILPSIYEKQTWEIDVVSGATYSSRGILGAVQNAITGEVVENEHPAEENRTVDTETFQEPAAYKDGTYTGSAQGFGGTISVKVVIKDGKLKDIKVTDASGETPEYYAKAVSVVSAMLKKGSPNVDTISGATYSSSGIITAVKRALAKAGGKEVKESKSKKAKEKAKDQKNKTKKKQDKKTVQEDFSGTSFADGTFTGTGFGFGGNIDVEVTIKKGRITKIKIVSAKDETPDYFNKAKEITKTMIKRQDPHVDAVSGATFSSEGIKEAVKEALLKSAEQYQKEHGKTTEETETTTAEQKEPESPSAEASSGTEETSAPDETTSSGEETTTQEENTAKYADGVYTGSALCDDDAAFMFSYTVVANVTVVNGAISNIDIEITDDNSEDPEDNDVYFNWALFGRGSFKGIRAQILESGQADQVDVVSRATYSSRAMIEAIRQALAQAANE